MWPPIRIFHNFPPTYRRRSRRSRRSPYRFLSAGLLLLALVLAVVLVDRGLSQPKAVRAAPPRGAAAAAPKPAPAAASAQLAVAGLDPSACRSYPPTSGDLGKTVFLDPGHGGADPGAVGVSAGSQVLEKDATLAVATQLATILRGSGYRVVLARTQDTMVTQVTDADLDQGSLRASSERRDLLARVACANASGASALLSIHFNGFDDPSVGGAQVIYDAARPFAAQNQRLAQLSQAELVKALGVDDRGTLTDDQLNAPALTDAGSSYGHLIELGPAQPGWLDQPTIMPGALAEPLFVTNPQEAQLITGAVGQRRVAGALAAAMTQFLEKP
jgi:N-acetylmuramoyl-L-alanine amidase